LVHFVVTKRQEEERSNEEERRNKTEKELFVSLLCIQRGTRGTARKRTFLHPSLSSIGILLSKEVFAFAFHEELW